MDPIGLKGARVTGYISLPGALLACSCRTSRRSASQADRLLTRGGASLRDLVNEARAKGFGFIVRTAAEDANC